MALLAVNFFSHALKIHTAVNVILPQEGVWPAPVARRLYPTLYLLHGLSDDASAWQRYTSIETVAAVYGLVVVMPSVGRSFYADQPNGQRYFTYLTTELPQYLDDVFGLAPKREDTFIAGVSMGGYGALKAAFHCPQRYAAAASISGALSLEILRVLPNDPRQAEFTHIFGDLDRLSGSEHDPAAWLQNAAQNPGILPRLFIASGRQEDLYPLGLHFRAACQALGIPLDYHEEDGQHDWFFWDRQIRRFLAAVLEPPTV